MASSVPVLVKRHVFGINNRFNDNVVFLDQSVLIYVAGRHIVFYNIEEHSQRFVVGSSPSVENWVSDPEICCISLSPSTHHLAIAEKGEKPCITIVETQTLRKKNVLSIPTSIRSKDIRSMSFTFDNIHIAIQCGPPDWKLCVFEWEKCLMKHCITTSKESIIPIHNISYCPNNTDLLAVCNQKSVRIYQQFEEELKEQTVEIYPYSSESKWTTLCWNNDILICGNNKGDVISLKDGKFQQIILSKKDCNITCIECVNRSILAIGSGDNCHITFIQKIIENDGTSSTNWSVLCNIKIEDITNNDKLKPIPISMTIDPSEKQLIVSTQNKQIYGVNINDLSSPTKSQSSKTTTSLNDNSDNNNKLSESLTKSIHQPLGHFHSLGITGMDICTRKPWIVTCGLDRSICIWNYLTKKLEIIKYFSTDIHSISFHPSGLHLLAGFTDKLKLLNILQDDIEAYKDFHIIRSCPECKFTHGGHLFAAVNGDKIHIYETYSGSLLSILRGHNQKIRSLYWNYNDTSLISAGAEGAVYEWSIFSFNRIQEHVNRQCPLNTAIITRDKKIYSTGSTPLLNCIIDSQLESEMDCGGIEITQLVISESSPPLRMLFASTINGLIRSMKFPLTSTDPDDHNNMLNYVSHLGAISSCAISNDNIYLFTCGMNDGCINLFEIRSKEGRVVKDEKKEEKEIFVNNWSTEILVTSSYLYTKKQLILELRNKVDELKLHNEYQLRLREMHYQDTLRERADKFNRELFQQKQKYEVLKDEQQDLEMEYEEKIKLSEDQHDNSIQQLEAFYQSQLMREISKYNKLDSSLNNEQNIWEINTEKEKNQHIININKLNELNNNKLNNFIRIKNQYNSELKGLKNEYTETKEQLLEDFDLEIEELKLKYNNILDEERESTLRLKGENGVMKKKFASLQNCICDQIEESRCMAQQENKFRSTINLLKLEISSLDKSMINRDNIIGEKEKKIYKLKKKNQNLEKHKFVLDYRIKTLKKQIEPRQNKITEMRDAVQILDFKLESLHSKNGELKNIIKNHLNNLNKIRFSIKNISEIEIKKFKLIINKFVYDLNIIISSFIQSSNNIFLLKFNNLLNDKNNKYILNYNNENNISENVRNEYERQKNHLKNCINKLKKILKKQSKKNQKNNFNIMMENEKYMNEIQLLRKELKKLTNSSSSNSNSNNNNNNQNQLLLKDKINKQNKQIKLLKNEIKSLSSLST